MRTPAVVLLSDSLIAGNRFVRPLAWAPVIVQAGLVLSLLG